LFSGGKLIQLHQTEENPFGMTVWSMHDIRDWFIWLLCSVCFHRAAHEYIYIYIYIYDSNTVTMEIKINTDT